MTLVRIVKSWSYPDLMQQTPAGAGVWDGIQFTLDPAQTCDALIALNHARQPIEVKCPPQNVWALVQEPPTAEYRWLESGFKSFARVYTPDVNLTSPRYFHSHGALPWQVGKSYDFLKNAAQAEKSRSISCIIRRATGTAGKNARIAFLDALSRQMEIDLWGRDFTPIGEKWDALAPYGYSLAIENYSGAHYWTEKISDCFLAWTMPIYYGATNIADYFPPESMLQIDIAKPEEARAAIEEAVRSGLCKKNRDAIAHARELVLEKYQLFPFIARLLRENTQADEPRLIRIPANLPPRAQARSKNLFQRLTQKIRSIARSLWAS